MKIGYLHLAGSPQAPKSGVTRYGKYLAYAVRHHLNLATIEYDLYISNLDGQLSQGTKTLSSVDILHVQYSTFIWHETLSRFLDSLQIPVLVTLHDIHQHLYPTGHWLQHLWTENYKQRALSNFKSLALRSTWSSLANIQRNRRSLKKLLNVARLGVTCHSVERQRLAHLHKMEQIQVIPHFVEMRPHLLPKTQAKAQLNYTRSFVVTLQGYIYRTKGHELAIRALSLLSDNVQLVFAGGCAPGNENFLQELQCLAKRLKVSERLHITGYLSEDDLELYLAATDLAICPFQTLSASGSLSSWISSETKILAHDLPQIQDYNHISPGAITTFFPYTAEALAASIRTALASVDTANLALIQLKSRLNLTNIANQYCDLYRTLVN